MDESNINEMPLQIGQASCNDRPPIFGGDNDKMEVGEEPFEGADDQCQMINTFGTEPFSIGKRKLNDDQDHPVSKTHGLEDGSRNNNPPGELLLLYLFNYITFHNSEKPERKGSKNDVRSLDATFFQGGYENFHFENLTYDKTLDMLKEIQAKCNLGGICKLVLGFMSHGDGSDPDNFVTSDCWSISMSCIRNMFNNRNCPGLKGIPIVFLAIFCRDYPTQPSPKREIEMSHQTNKPEQHSMENDDEVEHDPDIEKFFEMEKQCPTMKQLLEYTVGSNHFSATMMDTDDCLNWPAVAEPDDFKNMLTIYSCKPGKISNRHHRTGSVMVQCLCQVLDKYGRTHPGDAVYHLLEEKMKQRQARDELKDIPSPVPYCPDRTGSLMPNTYFFPDPI